MEAPWTREKMKAATEKALATTDETQRARVLEVVKRARDEHAERLDKSHGMVMISSDHHVYNALLKEGLVEPIG